MAAAAVACLLLGNVALWMRQDVYSARNVSAEAQRIVGSSNVQGAVADLLTAKVLEPVLAQAQLGPFMGLAEKPLLNASRRLVQEVVATQPAQHVAARLIEEVVRELDRGSGPIALSPDQLAWVASPSLAGNRLVASVLHTADTTGCCQVVLAQRQSLAFSWRHVGLVRTAGLALPALSVVLAAIALGLARRRGRLALIMAGATALTGLLTLASVVVGPHFWVGFMVKPGPTAGVFRAADTTVFNRATAGLWDHSLVVAAAGACLLAALAAGLHLRTSRLMAGAHGGG
jgi:hypothetical protein